jgi:hypothetical protein
LLVISHDANFDDRDPRANTHTGSVTLATMMCASPADLRRHNGRDTIDATTEKCLHLLLLHRPLLTRRRTE